MFHFSNFFRTFLIVVFFSCSFNSYAEPKKIGVIVPLAHEAMNQIVSGIEETLQSMDVKIIIKNAHSDPNIMLGLIQQMKDQNIDIIMPIGTSASQMTISHIQDKPIICVAALKSKTSNNLVTGVNDEIPVSYSLSKLTNLRNIAVIYSASEKIAPEVEHLKEYAAKNNIRMHFAMVQNLVDLPLAVRSSPNDIEAFLILKDHIICSGINILKQEANKRYIPIIASDEGSVIKGATIAIGVKEKDIGVESALLAKSILKGTKPRSLGYKTMNSLVVFVNEKSILEQNILSKADILKLKMPITSFPPLSKNPVSGK